MKKYIFLITFLFILFLGLCSEEETVGPGENTETTVSSTTSSTTTPTSTNTSTSSSTTTTETQNLCDYVLSLDDYTYSYGWYTLTYSDYSSLPQLWHNFNSDCTVGTSYTQFLLTELNMTYGGILTFTASTDTDILVGLIEPTCSHQPTCLVAFTTSATQYELDPGDYYLFITPSSNNTFSSDINVALNIQHYTPFGDKCRFAIPIVSQADGGVFIGPDEDGYLTYTYYDFTSVYPDWYIPKPNCTLTLYSHDDIFYKITLTSDGYVDLQAFAASNDIVLAIFPYNCDDQPNCIVNVNEGTVSEPENITDRYLEAGTYLVVILAPTSENSISSPVTLKYRFRTLSQRCTPASSVDVVDADDPSSSSPDANTLSLPQEATDSDSNTIISIQGTLNDYDNTGDDYYYYRISSGEQRSFFITACLQSTSQAILELYDDNDTIYTTSLVDGAIPTTIAATLGYTDNGIIKFGIKDVDTSATNYNNDPYYISITISTPSSFCHLAESSENVDADTTTDNNSSASPQQLSDSNSDYIITLNGTINDSNGTGNDYYYFLINNTNMYVVYAKLEGCIQSYSNANLKVYDDSDTLVTTATMSMYGVDVPLTLTYADNGVIKVGVEDADTAHYNYDDTPYTLRITITTADMYCSMPSLADVVDADNPSLAGSEDQNTSASPQLILDNNSDDLIVVRGILNDHDNTADDYYYLQITSDALIAITGCAQSFISPIVNLYDDDENVIATSTLDASGMSIVQLMTFSNDGVIKLAVIDNDTSASNLNDVKYTLNVLVQYPQDLCIPPSSYTVEDADSANTNNNPFASPQDISSSFNEDGVAIIFGTFSDASGDDTDDDTYSFVIDGPTIIELTSCMQSYNDSAAYLGIYRDASLIHAWHISASTLHYRSIVMPAGAGGTSTLRIRVYTYSSGVYDPYVNYSIQVYKESYCSSIDWSEEGNTEVIVNARDPNNPFICPRYPNYTLESYVENVTPTSFTIRLRIHWREYLEDTLSATFSDSDTCLVYADNTDIVNFKLLLPGGSYISSLNISTCNWDPDNCTDSDDTTILRSLDNSFSFSKLISDLNCDSCDGSYDYQDDTTISSPADTVYFAIADYGSNALSAWRSDDGNSLSCPVRIDITWNY